MGEPLSRAFALERIEELLGDISAGDLRDVAEFERRLAALLGPLREWESAERALDRHAGDASLARASDARRLLLAALREVT